MKRWRLCREIDKILGAIRTCIVYVLRNFSGFAARVSACLDDIFGSDGDEELTSLEGVTVQESL